MNNNPLSLHSTKQALLAGGGGANTMMHSQQQQQPYYSHGIQNSIGARNTNPHLHNGLGNSWGNSGVGGGSNVGGGSELINGGVGGGGGIMTTAQQSQSSSTTNPQLPVNGDMGTPSKKRRRSPSPQQPIVETISKGESPLFIIDGRGNKGGGGENKGVGGEQEENVEVDGGGSVSVSGGGGGGEEETKREWEGETIWAGNDEINRYTRTSYNFLATDKNFEDMLKLFGIISEDKRQHLDFLCNFLGGLGRYTKVKNFFFKSQKHLTSSKTKRGDRQKLTDEMKLIIKECKDQYAETQRHKLCYKPRTSKGSAASGGGGGGGGGNRNTKGDDYNDPNSVNTNTNTTTQRTRPVATGRSSNRSTRLVTPISEFDIGASASGSGGGGSGIASGFGVNFFDGGGE